MKKINFHLYLVFLIIFFILISQWSQKFDFSYASLTPGWIPVNHMLPDHLIVHDLTVVGENNEFVVIGTDTGAFLSNDYGMSWKDVSRGLRHPEILCLAADSSGERLYAGTRRSGVARFMPEVGNWARYSTNLPAITIHSLVVADQYVYAGTNYEGLFRVRIGSERWEDLTQDDKNAELKDCLIEDIAVISENHLILATDKGLLVTENGGDSWRYLTDFATRFRQFTTICYHPSHSQIIAGSDGKGLVVSTDHGKSWQEVNFQHPDITQAYVQSIFFDPDHIDTWYIALDREGVYYTIDRGRTWQPMNQGLINPRVQSMIRLPEDELSLMVGTMGTGVFKYVKASPPEAPVWSYDIGSQTIRFEWEKPKHGSYPLGGYVVYRSLPEQPYQWKERVRILPDILHWTEEEVVWGETWVYAMRSFDQQEKPMYSAFSEIKSILVNDDPLIELYYPPQDYETEEETLQLQGRVTDEGSGVQSLHLKHQTGSTVHLEQSLTWDIEGAFTFTLPLVLGPQEIRLVATDQAGNTGELTRGLVRKEPLVDEIPPLIELYYPPQDYETEEETLQLQGRVTDEGSGVQSLHLKHQTGSTVHLEQSLTWDIEGAFTFTLPLVLGPQEIRLVATDQAGNTGELTRGLVRKEPLRELIIRLQIGNTTAMIGDRSIELPVAPQIFNSRTMVPLRFLAEAFGARVQWVASRREIQVAYRDIFITLWIGETRVVIENLLDPGKPPIQKHLDVYPYLVKGTTMVPIRFISEEFNAQIQWENSTQEIIIRWEP